MNNRDDDFAINSDVVLYNTSLTEMHSGDEDGTIQWGRNINNGDGMDGDGDGGVISPFPYYFNFWIL